MFVSFSRPDRHARRRSTTRSSLSVLRRRRPAPVVLLALLVVGACTGSPAATTGSSGSSNAATSTSGNEATAAGVDLSGVTLKVGQIGLSIKPVLEFADQADTPYTVDWAQFAAAPPLLEALNAGAIDLGNAGDTGLIAASSGGATFTLVAAVSSPGKGMSLLVPAGSTVQSVADLRGKQVAVFRGSAGHAFLLAALARAGLSLADVELVDLQPADAAAAFQSGQIDAWAIWEPTAAQARLQSQARLLESGDGFFESFGFFVTRPSTLDDPARTAAIGDFLRRFAQANAYRSSHLADWIAEYARITKLPEEVAALAAPNQQSSVVPIDDDVSANLANSVHTFLAAGLIKTAPDLSPFFDRRFTPEIEAGLQAADGG